MEQTDGAPWGVKLPPPSGMEDELALPFPRTVANSFTADAISRQHSQAPLMHFF